MPVDARVQSIEIFSEFQNGSDFSLNPLVTSPNLKGPAGGRRKARIIVDFAVYAVFDSWTVTESNSNDRMELRVSESRKWRDEGFDNGDFLILLVESPSIPSYAFTYWQINFLSDDRHAKLIQPDGLSNAFALGTNSSTEGRILAKAYTPRTSVDHNFGFIENSESDNFLSKFDESTLAYSFDEIGPVTGAGITPWEPSRDTSIFNGEFKNPKLSSQTGSLTGRFTGYKPDANHNVFGFGTLGQNTIQSYTFEHEFIIPYYYRDGELSNLETGVLPLDIFANQNSLKYIFGQTYRSNISADSTGSFTKSEINGQVSYFGEVFNNNAPQYELVPGSVTITDGLGNPRPQLVANQLNRFNFQIQALNLPDFGTDAAVMVAYISKLPTTDEYSNQDKTFKEIWSYESERNIQNALGVTNDIIRDFFFAENGSDPTIIDVQLDIQFTDLSEIANDDNYLLWVELNNVNSADAINTGKLQSLVVFQDTMFIDTDIPGLLQDFNLRLYNQGEAPVDFNNDGFSDGHLFLESPVSAVLDFNAVLNVGSTITDIVFRYAAYNTVTGESFNIQSFNVPVQTPLFGVAGEQVITFNGTRGYELAAGNPYNEVEIYMGTLDIPGQLQQYYVKVPFICTYQEWLEATEAEDFPSVFVNNSLPFDGKNLKSSRYSNTNNWQIRAFYDITVNNSGVDTVYRHSSQNLDVYDYEQDNLSPALFAITLETFKEDLTPTNGNILTNEPTLIRATYTPNYALTPGYPSDASEIWGTVKIEPQNQPGDDRSTASTEEADFSGSRVKNATKQMLVGGIIVIEATTDPNNLDPTATYKIASEMNRIGSPSLMTAYSDGFSDGFS